ncbi:MAG: hypothetical protein NC517_08650 [Firmicutes bacterium]|nr:hypothetical protein [Bacillota bacterium]
MKKVGNSGKPVRNQRFAAVFMSIFTSYICTAQAQFVTFFVMKFVMILSLPFSHTRFSSPAVSKLYSAVFWDAVCRGYLLPETVCADYPNA